MTLASVEELFDVLRRGSAFADEERLDLLQHSLQCGALLRERAPDDVELQVAGLVHDIGSVVEPNRPATHSATGADLVRGLLGSRVATLVRGHDLAKRYLVVADASYRDRLSDRSVITLAAQGGPVDDDERAAFEADPSCDALVTLRRADDDAKVAGLDVAGLGAWGEAVARVAADHG